MEERLAGGVGGKDLAGVVEAQAGAIHKMVESVSRNEGGGVDDDPLEVAEMINLGNDNLSVFRKIQSQVGNSQVSNNSNSKKTTVIETAAEAAAATTTTTTNNSSSNNNINRPPYSRCHSRHKIFIVIADRTDRLCPLPQSAL
jgi:hypothetical protein